MIHVSTPDSDTAADLTTGSGGDPRDSGDAPTRTAVQLDPDLAMAVLGAADTNLRALEDLLRADLHVRGGTITISGDRPDVDRATRVVSDLLRQARRGVEITPTSVRRSVEILAGSGPLTPEEVLGTDVLSRRGGMIRPKTLGQKRYVDAIDDHTIVFGLGPAGTGKTYLAMAKAVAALRAKEVSRIILTRPAVEAGERLGYLPGTLHEKIDPYLRPLYDSLHDMMDPEAIPKLMAAGVIEVAPLAYMRGRTLNDSFIILDEAQNTTPEQMKMFLTRLGFGSKIVVTGDITQIDLPGGQRSGLKVVRDILTGVDDINFSELTSKDVIRHALVGRIVDAYAKHEARLDQGERPTAHRNREQRRR
ncbi:PhoH family protein [Dietzia sp. ANT_WB102]|uniref:PhoH family protein n=1 Tax=Dietzia sp. ANT_WB102 TaxID=2597345 RepID=UPI0011EFC4AA|nr:PhoH family protein [Dietzia sp. ANT_WB102]KAA0917176.1 PhoH family protein [Dietzia sp. ANT_WB102]